MASKTKEAIGALSSVHAEGASLAFYTFINEKDFKLL